MSNEKIIPDAPEPCLSYSNTEASCWQSGWESGYQAALAQQSEPEPTMSQFANKADYEAAKNMYANLKGQDDNNEAQVSQELQQEVNVKETGLLISKVARLEAENARLQSERDSLAKELTDKVDYWYDETQTLKLRVAELDTDLKRAEWVCVNLEVAKEKVEAERNRPFEQWSDNDGIYWVTNPADKELVNGMKVGDTIELLAGYKPVRIKYVVTKIPDDVSNDYEVEQAK